MREILFRGKRVDNGEWVQGWLCSSTFLDNTITTILVPCEIFGFDMVVVDPETVGQFTGLTDKNGKKIFEGDILNCITSDFDGSEKYVYNFKITDITDFERMGFLDFCNELEVIRNIHDNPELMKGGADNV